MALLDLELEPRAVSAPAGKSGLIDLDLNQKTEPQSLFKEVPIQTYAGATIDLPKQVGQALQWMSESGDYWHERGKELQGWAEQREKSNPDLAPDVEGRGLIGRALSTGARAIAPSVSVMVPAAAGAVAAPALGVAAAVGAGAGAAAGAFGLFGAAQAQETYDKLLKSGVAEPEAREAGWINLMIEGGGETLGDIAGLKLFGMLGKAAGIGATPVARAISGATNTAVLAPFAKQLPKTAATEIATEFGQNYGEAWIERRYGAKNAEDPLHAGIEGAESALGMTLLLAPFGLAGFANRAKRNERVATALTEGDAPKPERIAASKILYDEINAVNPEAARAWSENSAFAITTGAPILLDEKFAAPGVFYGGPGQPASANDAIADMAQARVVAEERRERAAIGAIAQAPDLDTAIGAAVASTTAVPLEDRIAQGGRILLDALERKAQIDEEFAAHEREKLESAVAASPGTGLIGRALRDKLGIPEPAEESATQPAQGAGAKDVLNAPGYGPGVGIAPPETDALGAPPATTQQVPAPTEGGMAIPTTPAAAAAATAEHLTAARNLTRSEETRAIIDEEMARRAQQTGTPAQQSGEKGEIVGTASPTATPIAAPAALETPLEKFRKSLPTLDNTTLNMALRGSPEIAALAQQEIDARAKRNDIAGAQPVVSRETNQAASVVKIAGTDVTKIKLKTLRGYVNSKNAEVATKASAELARREEGREQGRQAAQARKAAYDSPSRKFLRVLIAMGGLRKGGVLGGAHDVLGEKNAIKLGGTVSRLFREGGKSMDDMAISLSQPSVGWITPEQMEDGGVARLKEMIVAAANGTLEPILEHDIEAAGHREMEARAIAEMAKAQGLEATPEILAAIEDVADAMEVNPDVVNELLAGVDSADVPDASFMASIEKVLADENLGRNEADNRGSEGAGALAPREPATPAAGGQEVAKPLYASRPVRNAAKIVAWARAQGFATTLAADEMHVTVAYSSTPIAGSAVGATGKSVVVKGGQRSVEPLGDKGAVVLKFDSPELSTRWQQYRDAGASWDYEGYTPHVTITYDGQGVDLDKVVPYDGPIVLGAEVQEDLNEDKAEEYVEQPTGGTAAPAPLELAPPQTNEQVAAAEKEKREAAARAEAAGKAAEAQAKADTEKKAIGERSAAVAGEFSLTSTEAVDKRDQAAIDRKAAEDQLAGQGDIFSQPAAPAGRTPAAEEGPAEVKVFASGMSRARDFGPALAEDVHVGVDAGQLSNTAIGILAKGLATSNSHVFVDSGAFSMFRANLRQKGGAQFGFEDFGEGGKALDFKGVIDRQVALIEAVAKADTEDNGRPSQVFPVMPDIVGDQNGTLAALRDNKQTILENISESTAIYPLQAGARTLLEQYDETVKIMGAGNVRIVGIPSNEEAAPADQVRELLEARGDDIDGVHFLGAGSRKTLTPRVQAALAAGFEGEISGDSNILRSKMMGAGDRAAALRAALADREPAAASERDQKLAALADKIDAIDPNLAALWRGKIGKPAGKYEDLAAIERMADGIVESNRLKGMAGTPITNERVVTPDVLLESNPILRNVPEDILVKITQVAERAREKLNAAGFNLFGNKTPDLRYREAEDTYRAGLAAIGSAEVWADRKLRHDAGAKNVSAAAVSKSWGWLVESLGGTEASPTISEVASDAANARANVTDAQIDAALKDAPPAEELKPNTSSLEWYLPDRVKRAKSADRQATIASVHKSAETDLKSAIGGYEGLRKQGLDGIADYQIMKVHDGDALRAFETELALRRSRVEQVKSKIAALQSAMDDGGLFGAAPAETKGAEPETKPAKPETPANPIAAAADALIQAATAMKAAVEPAPAKPAAADLIGKLVKLQVPGLNGPRNVAGTVTRERPGGKVEVRLQQGGYETVDVGAVTPVAAESTEGPGTQASEAGEVPAPSAYKRGDVVRVKGQDGNITLVQPLNNGGSLWQGRQENGATIGVTADSITETVGFNELPSQQKKEKTGPSAKDKRSAANLQFLQTIERALKEAAGNDEWVQRLRGAEHSGTHGKMSDARAELARWEKAKAKGLPETAGRSRDAFTVDRLNRETDAMEPVTFQRGEYVKYKIGDTEHFGEITGISQARQEFAIGALWYPFGFAYKTDRPAGEQKPTVPLGKAIEASNARHGAGLTDVDKILTLEEHDEFMGRMRDGNVTPEELRIGFERAQKSRPAIVAELEKRTKKELVKLIGSFGARESDSKESLVKSAYRSVLSDFNLSDSLSYNPMDKDGMINALRAKVEATTADMIADFAKRVAEARAEREHKIAGWQKALTDPQSLEDFKLFIKYKGEGKLTADQRVRYDELVADKNREARKADIERGANVEAAGEQVGATIVATEHTRDKYPLWVVKLEKRVSSEDYTRLNSAAKRLGGWYSRYAKDGAIPGFQFKTEEGAAAFKALATEGDTAAVKEAVIERRAERGEQKKNAAAQRLTDMADAMEEKANASLNADRQVNTARRARMAGGAEAEARKQIAMAKTMRNLANALESGEAKHLDGIRHRTQLDALDSVLRSAWYDYIRSLEKNSNLSHNQREAMWDSPPTAEAIAHAKMRQYRMPWSDVVSQIGDVRKLHGYKQFSERLRSMAVSTDANGSKWAEFTDTQAAKYIEAMDKMGRPRDAWQLRDAREQHMQFGRMGIPDDETLRTALREYLQFKGDAPKADRVKELERALAGMGKNVGIDFFPTPAPLAEELAQRLDVQPGMTVLEPSAGKGNLADAVRAVQPEAHVDVVEQSNTLREILQAKGYEPAAHDFMDFNPGPVYDRIVMNPPFSERMDAEHVRHAYDMLKPGGRLIAITGEGVHFGKDAKAVEFRAWLDSVNAVVEKLPENTFMDRREVNTTGVASRTILIDKPAESGGQSAMSDSTYADPSAAEASEVEAAVTGATPAQAARYLVKNGTEDQKLIASRVLAQLQRLEKAGVALDMKVAHVGDTVPNTLTVARGLNVWKFNKGDNRITIWLNGGDVTGKVGMSKETLLHELVHMATVGVIHLGNLKAAAGTRSSQDVTDLYAVTNHIIAHFNKRVADSKAGKADLTEFERKVHGALNNAFRDPHETVAWGLTNPEAQAYLESIPYPAHKSAWSAFVDAIRKVLGIPARAATALSEVLRVSENLMGDNVNELLGIDTAAGENTGIQSQVNSGILAQFSRRPIQPLARRTVRPGKEVWNDGDIALEQSQKDRIYKGITLRDFHIADVAMLRAIQAGTNETERSPRIGKLTLGLDPATGEIQALYNIEIDHDIQAGGHGERTLRAVLGGMPADATLTIKSILPEAQGFWDKMGTVPLDTVSPLGYSDGYLTRDLYEKTRQTGTTKANTATGAAAGPAGFSRAGAAPGDAKAPGRLRGSPEGDRTPGNDTLGPARGLSVSAVRATLASAIDSVSVPVTIHPSIDAARKALGITGEFGFRGAYSNGVIHLVADELNNPLEAQFTFWHEAQHAGFARLYGASGHAYSQALMRIAGQNRTLRVEAGKWRAEHGPAVREMALSFGMTGEQADRYVRMQAIDEALADMAGRNEKISGVKEFIAAVQKIMRAIGLDALADYIEGLTDASALTEITKSRRAIAGQGQSYSAAAPAYHRVWHAGPHEFDEFKLQHIGSGEGAQAYGWGMYFADNRGIAEHYRRALSPGSLINKARNAYDETDSPDDALEALLKEGGLNSKEIELLNALAADDWLGFDYPHQAVQAAFDKRGHFEMSPRTLRAIKDLGYTYEAELAPSPEDYLDWDRPLSEQSEKVRAALATMGFNVDARSADTGSDTYTNLVTKLYEDRLTGKTPKSRASNTEAASKALLAAGIPGIRYSDNATRGLRIHRVSDTKFDVVDNRNNIVARDLESRAGAQSYIDEQPHNYVIFDDSLVKVQAKFSRADYQQERTRRIDQLEKEVDAAYERGDPKAEDLDAELADLREREDNADTEQQDFYDTDDSDVRIGLAHAYANWLKDDGRGGMAREDIVNNMRETIESGQGGFPLKGVTDAEILAAAKDAHEAQQALRARRKGAVPAFSRASQTDTPEFKRWFGDSKVVDAEGRPLVVYHGTVSDVSQFDASKAGSNTRHPTSRLGFWFSESPDVASLFTRQVDDSTWPVTFKDRAGANVMPAYISISKPFVMSVEKFRDINSTPYGEDVEREQPEASKKFNDWIDKNKASLVAKGYDGIKVEGDRKYDDVMGGEEYSAAAWVAFRPEQIKSAAGNRGTFDAGNPDIRFSRGPAAAVQPALASARTLFEDLTRSDRVLNRVVSKVNTPFHIAETKPEFKPVYDEAQAYTSGVSRYANESADLAPDLLPRVESLADFKKHSPTNVDIATVAGAVHTGTLWGGPSPLDGRRWTDQELRAGRLQEGGLPLPFGPLTDKQIDLYHQHLASVGNSLQEHSKSLIWKLLKRAGLTLDHDMSLEDFAETARRAIDDAIDEKNAELEYLEDEDRIKAEAEQIAADHEGDPRDPRGEKAAAKFMAEIKRAAEKVRAAIEQFEALKNAVDDIEEKTNGLITHGYSPLMRFGPYAVYAETTDPMTGEKEQNFFGRYDTQAEANRAKRALQAEFPDATVTSGIMSKETHKLFQGMNVDALAVFAQHVTDDEGNPILQDSLMQEFFRIATTERSALKRQINRKGVPGFSNDVARGLAQFTVSLAQATSRNYHAAAILTLANEIRAGDLKDYAARYVRYLQDPQEESQALRGFMANYYILGSLAFGAVNMTQPILMTAPYLSQQTSWANAMRQLGRAAVDYTKGRRTLTAEEAHAFNRAVKEGKVAPQEIHQLRAATNATLLGSSPTWNKLESAAAARGIKLPGKLLMRKASFLWGSIYSMTEQFNRGITFIAAYRIAKANGERNPYASAIRAIDETQGVYNRANRPEISRGPIGGPLMTFKQFSIMYVELAKRLYKADKKAFGVLMLTLFVLAGGEGLPFAEDIEDLIDTIGQWLGFATNTKKRLRKLATDLVGKDIGNILLHGASAIPGVPIDVANRLGMQNLIPGTAIMKVSEPDKTRDITDILGPAASLAKDVGWAVEGLATGKAGALGSVLPLAIKNVAKGVQMADTGAYRDTRGRKVMDVDMVDAIFKGIGFQPAKVAAESRIVGQNYQDITLHKTVEAAIADTWATGLVNHEPEKVIEARQRLREWNERNPEQRIDIGQGQITRRMKEMRASREERFLRSAPPETRGGMRREFRE